MSVRTCFVMSVVSIAVAVVAFGLAVFNCTESEVDSRIDTRIRQRELELVQKYKEQFLEAYRDVGVKHEEDPQSLPALLVPFVRVFVEIGKK